MSPPEVDGALTDLVSSLRELLSNTSDGRDALDRLRWRTEFESDHSVLDWSVGRVAVRPRDQREVLNRVFSELCDRTPHVAEVVRLCAIPRRFDAELIGVLRNKPDDAGENAQFLETIAGYTFVLPHRGGGYEYEADIRDLLLDEWRTDATTSRFNDLNRKVAQFHWRIYEQSLQSNEHDVASLAEALHHLTCVSPGAAYDFFEEQFDRALNEDRFATCEALLDVTRGGLVRAATESTSRDALDKMSLREARLFRSTRRLPRAQVTLNELLARETPLLTPAFRRQVWDEFGQLSLELEKVAEASRAFEQALKLAARPDATAMDRALAHFNLALPSWTVGRYDRALAEFREAIHLSGGAALGVYARVSSSDILATQGRWREAWHMALDALHLARTTCRPNREVAEAVARRLLSLVGSRSPALIDTLFAEANALGSPQTARAALDARKDYAAAIQNAGQFARAGEYLSALAHDAARHTDPRFSTRLLLQTSLLRIDERRLDEAIELCSAALWAVSDDKGTSGDQASALINRAIANAARIREGTVPREAESQHWKYVLRDAEQAAKLTAQLGDHLLAALARAYMERARPSDTPEGTADAWAAIRTDLLDAPSYLACYHMLRGDSEAQYKRWAAAREQYRCASEFYDSVDCLRDAAQCLHSCATMAEREKDYGEAARLRADVAKRRREIAEVDRYRPSASAVAADDQNAAGVLHLYGGDAAANTDSLQAARGCFRVACSAATSVRWYYALNLAYTCAALGDWEEAVEALESSLASGPQWWRAPHLEALAREFRDKSVESSVAHAAADFREGRVAKAAEALEYVRASLVDSKRDEARLADVRAHLALIHLERKDLQPAIQEAGHALDTYRQVYGSGAPLALGRVCRSMIGDVQRYRSLTARLAAADLTDGVHGAVQDTLRTVRQALVSCLDEILELGPGALRESLPVVTPIVLELGGVLIPEDTSAERWVLFTQYIPQFRARLQRDFGIEPPGVLVRGNLNLSGGQYSILIDEVRVVNGDTPEGMRYVQAGVELAGALDGFQHAVPAVHPRSGEQGYWVRPGDEDVMTHAGVSSAEPLGFIVEHLQAVVRTYISELVGLQEIDTLLTRWVAQSAEVPPEQERLRLVKVIRRLLDEQVPLTRREEILRVVHADPAGNIDALLRSVRIGLKNVLPGNEPSVHRELLPEEWEHVLSPLLTPGALGGSADVAPRDVNRVLVQIRQWLQTRHPRTTIVVRSGELRPVVRRLTQAEFPENHVLAQEELVEQQPASADVSHA